MEIRDNGRTNPLLFFSPDEVLAWLREKADAAGYADRETSAVQIGVEAPFEGGRRVHLAVPELVLMVSNIKGSRTPPASTSPLVSLGELKMKKKGFAE